MTQYFNSDNIQEIPITTHVFEGYLYIKSDNNKWLWRLFRFDGNTLACLSAKKLRTEHPTTSYPGTTGRSHTSPISTPRNKMVQFVSASSVLDDLHHSNSHYQHLLLWTLNLANISSIAILKYSKPQSLRSKLLSTTNYDNTRCFSLRTYSGLRYIFKAQNEDDRERWLFVLSRMCNLVNTQSFTINLPIKSSTQQYEHHYYSSTSTQSPSKNNYGCNHQMHSSPIPPPHLVLPDDHEPVIQTGTSPQRKHIASLSKEKHMWVEEWINSLTKLTTTDKNNELSQSDTEYGSVRKSKQDGREDVDMYSSFDNKSSTRNKYNSDKNSPNSAFCPRDDRLNLDISTKHQRIRTGVGVLVSSGHPCDDHTSDIVNTDQNEDTILQLNFFQDIQTVYTDDTCTKRSKKEYTLRYHTSTRGKRVKMVKNHVNMDKKKEDLMFDSEKQLQMTYSPLECLTTEMTQMMNQQKLPCRVEDALENISLADLQQYLQKMNLGSDKEPMLNDKSTIDVFKQTNWNRRSLAANITTFT
ncbi:hypothetical protein BDB01DRAFT_795761 [Pilobolus umbonatus]|nr:hypothetical protein BDB01DRAFT_795761 [Pilobolus umbonatus]